jgi:hypothetical protein
VARRRATRGVKVSGLRSMVLDDVGARAAPLGDSVAEPLVGTLAGTERLDERVAGWLKERARFVRSTTERGDRTAEGAPPGSAP